MTGWLLALICAAAGAAQAGLLAQAARTPRPWAFPVRLVLVGGALVFAARAGHLAAGVAGWLAGFLCACVVAHRRLR